MRAFNVARPRQRNIYQITSATARNLHAYRQASGFRLNSFFISTTLCISAGFADFCRQFLARDGAIGPLLYFRGKIHWERAAGFVTILKMKDPDRVDWVYSPVE